MGSSIEFSGNVKAYRRGRPVASGLETGAARPRSVERLCSAIEEFITSKISGGSLMNRLSQPVLRLRSDFAPYATGRGQRRKPDQHQR